jgi:hypothetical protein
VSAPSAVTVASGAASESVWSRAAARGGVVNVLFARLRDSTSNSENICESMTNSRPGGCTTRSALPAAVHLDEIGHRGVAGDQAAHDLVVVEVLAREVADQAHVVRIDHQHHALPQRVTRRRSSTNVRCVVATTTSESPM